MPCLGVHFALTDALAEAVSALPGHDARVQFVQEVLEPAAFDDDALLYAETDQAWDAIHRSLTDGQLANDNGHYPLNHSIFGGIWLHQSADYLLWLKPPAAVRDIADALAVVSDDDFAAGYARIAADDYGMLPDAQDLAFTQDRFHRLRAFYAVAADHGLWVLFTVDQ